ncbi:MAG: hypothetical protein M3P48_10445 [Actinomycetota bacterium]|nr:hypothetical protein [Actinomycetota bacterium]
MIAIERSARPWLCDVDGERFSVQLTYNARKPEKSHCDSSQSSCCRGVSVVIVEKRNRAGGEAASLGAAALRESLSEILRGAVPTRSVRLSVRTATG